MFPALVLLSSSLRRTLQLSVCYSAMKKIFLYLVIPGITACGNGVSERDKILSKFDSVNNELKKEDTVVFRSETLYDSLSLKAWNDKRAQQLYYTTHDFYRYLSNLKFLFYTATGDATGKKVPFDKEDDMTLTNTFIKDKKSTAYILFPQLQTLISTLRAYTQKEATLNKINKFESVTTGHFPTSDKLLDVYFKNTPPVAVITILNSFEQTVKNIELDILFEYFKK